jgi:hypothetical protein
MNSADRAEADRRFAAESFDETWTLLALQDRTKDQMELMIHSSHSALYHLKKVPGVDAKSLVKGYWQLSRVYAAAGQGVVARTYAFRCLDEAMVSEDPFLKAIACEALGRAAAVLGDGAERDRQAVRGKEFAAQIMDPDTRAFCDDNLEAMPRTLGPGPSLPVF